MEDEASIGERCATLKAVARRALNPEAHAFAFGALATSIGKFTSVALLTIIAMAAASGCATGNGDDGASPSERDAASDTASDATILDTGRSDVAASDAEKDTTISPIFDADVATCPGTSAVCGGKCYDLETDVDHCGGCDHVCPTAGNAARTCVGALCGFSCNAGFDDCNKVALDGCEASLNDAVDHCGACGKVCPTGAGATAKCDKGACSLTCTGGLGDCDGAPGCETDLTISPSHCGTCAKACPSGVTTDPTCASGSCGTTCKSGYLLTGGFCSNVAGAFSTSPSCGCINANPYTASCTCPSGFAPSAALVARTDGCGIASSSIQFCQSAGAAVGVWGGAYQADDAVSCGLSCRVANPLTGGCSCPAGYATQSARVLITNECGSKIGSRIGLCIHPSVALDDFGGAYQIDDPVSGSGGCRMANVRTGDCSCPSGFGASAVRTLVDGSAGEIGGQLFTCFR